MKTMTGAEAVLCSLLQEQTEYIFGYPGGAIMPIYDALFDYKDNVTHILTRHEQGAIHAAQGYARVSGKTGVVFATSGPGATNLVTGLADALLDSTPLVCITGQVASSLLGTDAFQEIDIVGISTPVTKWNKQVTKAADIPAVLAQAFYIAQAGRPGPVLIDITKDAQFELMEFAYEHVTSMRSLAQKPALPTDELFRAAQLMNLAQRPLVLVGQGVILSNAEKQFLDFVEWSGFPVASTLLGLGAFPCDHPQYVGYLGMHGNYAPNKLTNEADVIFAVGMRFDDRVTGNVEKYAKQAKIIHLDIDAAEISKLIPSYLGLVADAKEALNFLTPLMQKRSFSQWFGAFKSLQQQEFEQVIRNDLKPESEELLMAEVVHALSEYNAQKNNLIVVTDVGQHQMVTSRYFSYTKSRRIVTSGGLGTMGFALPAAIGAALARPDLEVVVVVGDGGIQMTIQEFGTIMQYGLKVKVVLLNNSFLGMVRQWQDLFFEKRYSFTEMTNPDFGTIAKGYGVDYEHVDTRKALPNALAKLFTTENAFFLEVKVKQEHNVFPMVPTGAGVAEMILSEHEQANV